VLLTAAGTRPAPTARAIYLASRGGLILQASSLNRLANGKVYELWIIPANGSSPVPAGLFRPDASGTANLVLPQIPEGVQAKAFGITVENDGGSSTPTSPIVLSGAAPASGE
jgi:anti-sigma-K factor RskA